MQRQALQRPQAITCGTLPAITIDAARLPGRCTIAVPETPQRAGIRARIRPGCGRYAVTPLGAALFSAP